MDDRVRPVGDAFSIRRAFGNGFAAIRIALGPMWLAGLLMSISDGCGGPGGVPDLPGSGEGGEGDAAFFAPPGAGRRWAAQAFALTRAGDASLPDEWVALAVGFVIAVVLVALVVGALLFALHCWAQTGFVRLHVNVLERASDDLAPLFSGRDRFWHMAGYKLLAFLALCATGLATAWPGALLAYAGWQRDSGTWMMGGAGAAVILCTPALVYVGLGVFLGELAVVLEGAGPVHALRRSWSLARGNRLPLLAFGVVSVLVQIASVAGVLLCCVGALATVPLGRALCGFAKTESYLLFTRGTAQTAEWRLWQRQDDEDRALPLDDAPAPPGAGQPPG